MQRYGRLVQSLASEGCDRDPIIHHALLDVKTNAGKASKTALLSQYALIEQKKLLGLSVEGR